MFARETCAAGTSWRLLQTAARKQRTPASDDALARPQPPPGRARTASIQRAVVSSMRPRTSGSAHAGQGAWAWACEVILPPKDLPPARSGSPVAAAVATAARTVAWATRGVSGRREPRSIDGNWNRRVAMPRAARPSATACMNECVIPAPAPCANTSHARALVGESKSAETRPAPSTSNPGSIRSATPRHDALRHCCRWRSRPRASSDRSCRRRRRLP